MRSAASSASAARTCWAPCASEGGSTDWQEQLPFYLIITCEFFGWPASRVRGGCYAIGAVSECSLNPAAPLSFSRSVILNGCIFHE